MNSCFSFCRMSEFAEIEIDQILSKVYLFDEYILLKWIVYSDAKSRNVYSGSIPLPSEKGINVGAR